jgi:hypothetical protein
LTDGDTFLGGLDSTFAAGWFVAVIWSNSLTRSTRISGFNRDGLARGELRRARLVGRDERWLERLIEIMFQKEWVVMKVVVVVRSEET